jgi:hypothetical protein
MGHSRKGPRISQETTVPDINQPAGQIDPLTLKAALDSQRDALTQMSPSEINRTIRVDASAAAGIAIGSLPRIEKHRDAIAEQFGAEGVSFLDDLPILAYATEQANVELTAADSDSDLTALAAEVLEDHQLLLTDADALANRKLIERARIDAGRPVQGYRTLVTSTLVLVSLLREHWSVVEEKTPLTLEELAAIELRSQRMIQRLNEREQGSSRLPAAEMRVRALSKLQRTYGEVRRMLTYIRWWEEDADSIAPSLYTSRRARGRSESDEEIVVTEPAVPGDPTPTEGGPFTA